MENKIVDFLTKRENYYLGNDKDIDINHIGEFLPKDLTLYHIEEITFDEKAPRKEALENVLSSVRIEGINFVYLIMGDKDGVHFYFGIAKDLYYDKKMMLEIKDIGDFILEPNIKGNFRGSKIKEVIPEKKNRICDSIENMKYFSLLEGVAGVNKDNEKFQGVDRLVDVMIGDEFGFMIIAKPMNGDDIANIEENLNQLYTQIAPLIKKNLQDTSSETYGSSTTNTTGESSTVGKNISKSIQYSSSENKGETSGNSSSITKSKSETTQSNNSSNKSSSVSDSGQEGTNKGKSWSKTTGSSESKSEGDSKSDSKSSSVASGVSTSESKSSSTTVEFINKEIQEWIKYIDDVIVPRLDYGKGRGIFNTSAFLFSNKKAVLKKLESTIKSLFAGETGNRIPLQSISLNKNNIRTEIYKKFQLPHGKFVRKGDIDCSFGRSAISQYSDNQGNVMIGNWISTNELSLVAGLPQKEIVGLGLREEVQFGLNIPKNIKEEDKIHLGKLVHSGDILKNIDVSIDKNNLDKHLFITGVTGSGKTTTCQKILMDSKLPFLVIEPAKTEYRILTKNYEDILIFTLGKDTVSPFRLNPFEFFEHESITSRVDMIKASIEAAFDMEAAIPQLIETAIYECYKDYGWNIATNKNKKIKEPFQDGSYSFPTFSDLLIKIDDVVKNQGFDERLKNDYIGSIKARLQGLMVGSKGFMLNTKRSIDFEELLDKKVVLELEEIRSGSEKSLIMGFILMNLAEAIKAKYKKKGTFRHITLIEEAHRLLSKFTQGDSPNKKQGVETFTDMLAEIRKYGESLIIVDQIPNKLTSEVLKNTNTKIVHKIFAQDDKEAIGNTMVLSDEQKEFLSNLETGRAVLFTQGYQKAVQVQIERTSDTTSDEIIKEDKIRAKVVDFYCKIYKKGVFQGLECFDNQPSREEFEKFQQDINNSVFLQAYEHFFNNRQIGYEEKLKENLKNSIDVFGKEFFAKIILTRYYNGKRIYSDIQEKEEFIKKFIDDYINNTIDLNFCRNKLGIWR
ncbi:UNVERIFIED_ORG: hypothetical protein B2H95_05665 [Clostridium botulinum]|uniref:ATP-binding protein n=1 Tax=Clostridium sp. ZBS15 TaxID=2949969 RepID=UPI000A17186A|nr:ATP-binding protein [Clostridium sp. ZBS15]